MAKDYFITITGGAEPSSETRMPTAKQSASDIWTYSDAPDLQRAQEWAQLACPVFSDTTHIWVGQQERWTREPVEALMVWTRAGGWRQAPGRPEPQPLSEYLDQLAGKVLGPKP